MRCSMLLDLGIQFVIINQFIENMALDALHYLTKEG